MEVKNAAKGEVLWHATELTLRSLKQFAGVGNRIDVDGNGLIWRLFQKNSSPKTFNQVLHLMADYLKNIAFSGTEQ